MDTGALDVIAGEAAAVEGQVTAVEGLGDIPPLAGAAPDPRANEAEQVALWAMIPQTLGSVLSMAFPDLAKVYNPKACEDWGRAMVPVANKYGWNFSSDAPELALLLATVPFAIGTMVVVKRPRAQPEPGPAGSAAAAGRATVPGPASFPTVNEPAREQ
jgi:hypothetical protein